MAKLVGPIERASKLENTPCAALLQVPDQTIAEARVASSVCLRTLNAHLEKAVHQLHALCEAHGWRKEDSQIFNTDAEIEGVLFFARALLADRDGHEDEYARCMKEAFWLNPNAGPALAGELRVHGEATDLLNLRVPMHKRGRNAVRRVDRS